MSVSGGVRKRGLRSPAETSPRSTSPASDETAFRSPYNLVMSSDRISSREDDILSRCLDGDQRAWSTLVDRYSGLVYSIPRRAGLPPDVCDDVAQVVFSVLARRLSAVRNEASLAGWLSTVARRESWRARKRLGRRQSAEVALEDNVAAENDELQRLEQQLHIRWAFDALDLRCRNLLTELFLAPTAPSYEEVAGRLGIAVGSIGPTRRRCLSELMRILSDSNTE